MSDELLPKRDFDTPEHAARALLWAMDDLLQWDAPHPKAGRYLFRSSTEMADVWRSHRGDHDKLPNIDFDRFMVLALFMDEGAYNEIVAPKSVRVNDRRIVVTLGKSSRSWKMINPASVIRLKRCDGEVVFQDSAA